MIPNKYTKAEKIKLSNELNYVSEKDAIDDFEKLRDIGCKARQSGISNIGNKVVNRFTQVERLDTKTNRGLSFFDLLNNRTKIVRPSIDNLLKYYGVNRKTASIKIWKRVMDLYFGSINIFRPLIAMDIYCRYKPKSILDMTMGWGGRLVGACALDIPKYTGIDFNKQLEKPYEDLQHLMSQLSTTKINLYFQDAVTFNYNKIKYDLVLTSPPYYNIEVYRGVPVKSKDEWDKDFYIPLIVKSWNGLDEGGHYCLNIPEELYERVAYNLLGKPYEKIQLRKVKRFQDSRQKYHEFIYVWKK
jgi:hypothetical protein